MVLPAFEQMKMCYEISASQMQYNSLPESIVTAPSLNAFKNRLTTGKGIPINSSQHVVILIQMTYSGVSYGGLQRSKRCFQHSNR